MADGGGRSVLVFLGAGAAMLAASLFLGWYTVSATSQNVNVTQTFYA